MVFEKILSKLPFILILLFLEFCLSTELPSRETIKEEANYFQNKNLITTEVDITGTTPAPSTTSNSINVTAIVVIAVLFAVLCLIIIGVFFYRDRHTKHEVKLTVVQTHATVQNEDQFYKWYGDLGKEDLKSV